MQNKFGLLEDQAIMPKPFVEIRRKLSSFQLLDNLQNTYFGLKLGLFPEPTAGSISITNM